MPSQESDVEASTHTGSGDTANYAIWPRNGKNLEQTKAIQTLLESINPTSIYVSGIDNNNVIYFWAVPLTSEDAEIVKADPNVLGIVKECKTDYDPTDV